MNTETRIRIAAGVALATAMWAILPHWQSHVFLFLGLVRFAEIDGFVFVISVVLIELILFVQLISALALFRGLRWAWILAVVALSVRILLTSFTAIRFSFFPPPLLPPIDGEVVAFEINLWPNYFRALLNTFAVILLFSPKVRVHFRESNKETHNKTPEHISEGRGRPSENAQR